jgi:hypothetical protein
MLSEPNSRRHRSPPPAQQLCLLIPRFGSNLPPATQYCSNSSCSAFILPPNIKGDAAIRPRYRINVCEACKGRECSGVICVGDVNGQKWLGLADSKKWQQCAHCKNLMEEIEGCLHMTCTCGTHSCYNCGSCGTVVAGSVQEGE